MRQFMKNLLCFLVGLVLLCGVFGMVSTASAAGSASGPLYGVKDICVFHPYAGTPRDFFYFDNTLGELLASHTGGELLIYEGADATIDKLAAAMQTCAVVIIGSHGLDSHFGIQNTTGLTEDDYLDNHTVKWGKDGGTGSDAVFWGIDGTVITNHMTDAAPRNLVILHCCQGMKYDNLCTPLRNRGVAAVFGFSASPSTNGALAQMMALDQALSKGATLAEAFAQMQQDVSFWSTGQVNYTLEDALKNEVAFPIVVSEQDAYPGADNLPLVQDVQSNWTLPIRTDDPLKVTLPLDTDIGQKAIAANCKQATITAGSLPEGVNFGVKEDGTLYLNGTPTKQGYRVATLKILTKNNRTYVKPVGVMVADYAHVTKLPVKKVTFTAENTGNYGYSYLLESDTQPIYIPLEFTKEPVDTFTIEKYSGSLPYTLEYGVGEFRGEWYIQSVLAKGRESLKDRYFSTPPGTYFVTLDLITFPKGDVYRLPVRITVNPAVTLSGSLQTYTMTQYKKLTHGGNGIFEDGVRIQRGDTGDFWNDLPIQSFSVTGTLPAGVRLVNSSREPFGFYGTPTESGTFLVKCHMTTYNNEYDYNFRIIVNPGPMTVSYDNNGGTGSMASAKVNPGDSYTIADCAFTAPEGQVFDYWLLSEGTISENRTLFHPGEQVTPTFNITLKAIWSDEALSGEIVYATGVKYGSPVVIGRKGMLAELDTSVIHYQWQRSLDGSSDWTDIPEASEGTYTPGDDDIGQYIRVMATADGHTGAVYSTPRLIENISNTGDPVSPNLMTESTYSKVIVTNAKADQEYAVAYSLDSHDWATAVSPDADGTLELPAEKDRTVYVYTRLRERDQYMAGSKAVYSKIYNGYVTALADLVLDKSYVDTRTGEVTALTVSPLPLDFSGWNDAYQITWFVNGSEVDLYADEACSTPIIKGSPVPNKTVYVKALTPTNYVRVGVEKQVGFSDLRIAYCTFRVADAEGSFVLQQLNFDKVHMAPGETVTVNYTTDPTPAKVGVLSFEKTGGPADLTLTDNSDGTVTIAAPADAPAGNYYYRVKVDGANTPVISAIDVTVVAEKVTVTLDAANGLGQTEVYTVPYGAAFTLPDLPASFTIPAPYHFTGWDKGSVGQKIIIGEDTVIRAQWAEHVHKMMLIPSVPAGCDKDGMLAYYMCSTCGKLFKDASGTIELTSLDALAIPATGHSISAVPAKAPTCTEEGNIAYYFCTGCGECFQDAAGTKEYADPHEVVLDALGHDWGEWTISKKATATEEGEQTRTCKRCSETEKQIIPKVTAHIVVTVEPSGSGKIELGSESGTWLENIDLVVPAAENKLTAQAADGWQFVKWAYPDNTVASMANPYELTLTGDLTLKALFEMKAAPTVYAFTKGNGSSWTKGSNATLDFTVTGSPDDSKTFMKFTGIEVDGLTVAAYNYTVSKGSLNLSLKASYLESLSEKTHKLTVHFQDGEAEAAFTVQEKPAVPKTGDSANPALWLGCILLGLLGINGLAVKKHGKRG